MSLSRLAVLVSTALIGFGLPAPAVAAPPTTSREDSPLAISWLARAATAPNTVSYHGTQIITVGTAGRQLGDAGHRPRRLTGV